MIQAVGFDLDGTLFDHRAAAGGAIEAWVAQVAPAALRDDLATLWLALEDRYFRDHLAGRLGFQEQRRARLRELACLLGIELGEGELDEQFAVILGYYEAGWAADPDASEVLTELSARGLRLAVLTNGRRDQQRAKLERLGLFEFFEVVLAFDDLPAGKPSGLAFGAMAAALELPVGSIAYVGDDAHADGVGAHEAGMTSIWIDRIGVAGSVEGPHVITSLRELPDLVGRHSGWARRLSNERLRGS